MVNDSSFNKPASRFALWKIALISSVCVLSFVYFEPSVHMNEAASNIEPRGVNGWTGAGPGNERFDIGSLAQAQGRPDVVWMRGGHANSVRTMDYSPDGQLFVSAGDSYGLVKIWRLSDGLMLRTLSVLSPGASFAERAIFLSDSQTIAVFDAITALIKIVRVSDGEILRTIPTQGGTGDLNTNMKLMPDGTIFFATTLSIKFYRPSDGALLRTISNVHYLNSNGQPVNFAGSPGNHFQHTMGP